MRPLLAALAVLIALGASAGALAQPQEGREYRRLDPAVPAAPAAIEVVEFFYYGCPVCYEAQPLIDRWRQSAGPEVRWRRVPAVNGEGWESFARDYYALESLGQLERLHWPLYDSHHFDGRQLDVEANLVAWAAANGVDASRLRAALDSLEVRQKVEYAKREAGRYGVRGVPTIVVDGRFATSARMAGGVAEMMQVVQFLVERVRRERAAR
ncbi:MAG TPA: thiol:disulfide interchange protein DsbA/DsbL [Burkholderiales bacterium]|nr:thiol:disulfide interchange protein DsbA/DsbL [Burkholderiales bacterium]